MFQLDWGFGKIGAVRAGTGRTAWPGREKSDLLPWKHGIAVRVVRQPQARRYLLRLQADGTARLVIPRRGSRDEALRFLERSEPWLLRQRDHWQTQRRARLPWTDGTRFLFRGKEVRLQVKNGEGSVTLCFADQTVRPGAPQSDYREPIDHHLRRLAERELPPRTLELARQLGIEVKRVTVRSQKTRWGSCSARGTISLNWRIIHAPPEVRDYLIIHELMHRRQMNHSSRYWKLVAAAFPDYRAAELWLRKHRLA
ncbi:MAG TPA: SprT family zinc-dependent metalloprotease [Candidatus Methylacidiphilales bacterium]|nr:SprT family zinc-dependent metalloprotease [Candidatus Methylacidiphilales bacterium]